MIEAYIENEMDVKKTDSRIEDEKLVISAKNNLSEFKNIYEKWLNPVYRYCYFRVGNKNDAEDLTSQIFLKAYEGLSFYRHRGYFSAWLFSIARARVTDFYRKQKKDLPIFEANEIPDEIDLSAQVAKNMVLNQVHTIIHKLSDKDQELIRLRFVAGLTYREIGDLLHRKEDTVRKAVSRILERIKNEVNHE